VGKGIHGIVVLVAAYMLASFAGGFIAGMLGVLFGWSVNTVHALTWTPPKLGFLGALILLYLRLKHKNGTVVKSLLLDLLRK
jgi:ABC-type uncharacterized transport system permease subunit